jgi:lysophospholipase L1-like esterase
MMLFMLYVRHAFLVSAFVIMGCGSLIAQTATAFSYQGRLQDPTGNAVSGSYDFQMALMDAATQGNQIGSLVTNTGVGVSNGLFTMMVDFGIASFDGSARWLQIGVRTNGATTFNVLSPRQPLTPAPYALVSLAANGVAGTNVSGMIPAASLPIDAGDNVSIVTNANGHLQISTQGNTGEISSTNPVIFGETTYQPDIVSVIPVGVGGASGNYPPTGLQIHLLDSLGRPAVSVLRSAYYFTNNGLPSLIGIEPTGNACAMPTVFDFSVQASSFVFGIFTQPYLISVDGVSSGIMPASTNWWLQVQFPDYRWRHVQITGGALLGVGLNPTNGFLGGPTANLRRLIIMGDSVSEDPGQFGLGNGWGSQLMQMYLNLDVWSSGSGGTGYNATNSGRPNFLGRLQSDVITNNPDYVLFMGGFNDGADHAPYATQTDPKTGTIPNYTGASNDLFVAACACYSNIQRSLPNCEIIVAQMYCPHPISNYLAQQWSLGALKAAEAACNVTNIIDMNTDPWLYGTGNAGAMTGDGDCDVYLSGDNVHPTVAGQNYLAHRVAAQLAPMIPGLIPNPDAR